MNEDEMRRATTRAAALLAEMVRDAVSPPKTDRNVAAREERERATRANTVELAEIGLALGGELLLDIHRLADASTKIAASIEGGEELPSGGTRSGIVDALLFLADRLGPSIDELATCARIERGR